MIAMDDRRRHDEVWLLLPWLANGRLSPAERVPAEEHLRQCEICERELEVQEQMCRAFAAPDRVIYAAGPSFRKLMVRIDSGADGGAQGEAETLKVPVPRKRVTSLTARLSHVSLWRPPGLAWAASFLLLFGITGMMLTAYRWAEKPYYTHTDPTVATPSVLRIALDRSIPIGDAAELLRAQGARIIEGPGSAGVLAGVLSVSPIGVVQGQTPSATADVRLRELAARLRADPRVLWVQPLTDEQTPPGRQALDAADHRAPDVREH